MKFAIRRGQFDEPHLLNLRKMNKLAGISSPASGAGGGGEGLSSLEKEGGGGGEEC